MDKMLWVGSIVRRARDSVALCSVTFSESNKDTFMRYRCEKVAYLNKIFHNLKTSELLLKKYKDSVMLG